jgi:hypothetical protein
LRRVATFDVSAVAGGSPCLGVGSENGDSGRKASPPLWLRVSAVASGQWGVVSRAQLGALGVSRHTADHWLRVGRLHRVHQGVYSVGHAA